MTVDVEAAPERRRAVARGVARGVATALAAVLVLAVLTAPRTIAQVTPLAFVRIPVEALIGVGLLLVLPARTRRPVAVAGGVVLGLLTVLKIADMGFLAVVSRPFDPITDWTLVGNAGDFLGLRGGVIAGVALGATLLVGLVTASVVRLSGIVVRRRTAATRALAVATAAWLACAAVGAQLVAPVPVAARSIAALTVQKVAAVPRSVADQVAFDAAFDAPDPFATGDLLRGLHGKDVMLVFVESFGRSALEDPGLAPVVDPVLDDGTRRLAAAGYGARSAFLTSSTAGGGSWLAHATLLSGLWVTDQGKHDRLVVSDRLTLTRAFQRAGWDTVAVMPGTSTGWPDAAFFGIDRVRDAGAMGNRAQVYNRFLTPDQYTLAEFQRDERARPGRGPLMAEIPLVTSHWPWAHIPSMVGWDAVGDGSVYDAMGGGQDPDDAVLNDPQRARAGYRDAIAYSLNSLVSYVETYGDDDLVMIVLGDHQPASVVTGDGASHDVPISIVARDPKVLDRISGWGWQAGLHPRPDAPVSRMDTFRDRFLTAFS